MAVVIPIVPNTNQRLTCVLDGQEISLRLWWQPSDTGWYATMEFPRGTPLVRGRRISLYSGLLDYLVTPFRGNIYCIEITGGFTEPSLDSWGISHQLVWLP